MWNDNFGILNIRGGQGVFIGGTPTLPTDRPTSGSATYLGRAAGYAMFAGDGGNYSFVGNASLKADFGANTIAGWISSLTATKHVEFLTITATPTGGVNDIRLSGGSITGTSFSGAFYGPGAAEAADSLALTGPSTSVIASFSAAK